MRQRQPTGLVNSHAVKLEMQLYRCKACRCHVEHLFYLHVC